MPSKKKEQKKTKKGIKKLHIFHHDFHANKCFGCGGKPWKGLRLSRSTIFFECIMADCVKS